MSGLSAKKRRRAAADIGDAVVPLSDDALAQSFAEQQRDSLAYRSDLAVWMRWNGSQWQADDRSIAINSIRLLCRKAAATLSDDNKRARLTSMRKIGDIEKLARSDPMLTVPPVRWDSDDWLLNTPAGVVDLCTGKSSPHDPSLLISRMTPVGPGADCPIWRRFLDRVTGGDKDFEYFLQRVAGYCLTGSTREQVLFFLLGPGANGKSLFTRILAAVLGPYATTASMDTFMASRTARHPADLAALQGMRLVLASESERGRRFSETRIKILAGGDDISARFMGKNFATFTPRCKLMLVGNSAPKLNDTDEAMRRRLLLLPFTSIIPPQERDIGLFDKLSRELDGILGWAIEGCLEWQRVGLVPPNAVRAFTQSHFTGLDPLGSFLSECCTMSDTASVSSTVLYQAYADWCSRMGLANESQNAFARDLTERGYRHGRSSQERFIKGLRLIEGFDREKAA